MNSKSKKASVNNITFVQRLRKVPVWAWMVISGVASLFGFYYRTSMVVNQTMENYSFQIQTGAMFAIVLILVAVIRPVIVRLFARLDYSVASRIYYGRTRFVPDYNLRRLPIGYEDFLATALFLYTLIDVVSGVFGLLSLAFPYASYIISLPVLLFKTACYVWGAFLVKPYVADWELKNTYIALGIPSLILLVIGYGVLL